METCTCTKCSKPLDERPKPKRKVGNRKRKADSDIHALALQEQLHVKELELIEARTLLEKLTSDLARVTKKLMALKGNLRAFCRVRPHMPLDGEEKLEFVKRRELIGESISVKGSGETFTFDKVFLEDSAQEEVFGEISHLIHDCLDGFKVTIFAYGHTGSGKTHSMMGEEREHRGIIPRSLEKIFDVREKLKELGWEYHFEVSMVQFYGKKAYDMLRDGAIERTRPLKKSEHPVLVWENVGSQEDFHKVMKVAKERRLMRKTNMNAESSGSHLLITLRLHGHKDGIKEVEGILNLIDLAGGESPCKSLTSTQSDVAKDINMSLTTLRLVFEALCEKSQKTMPPFRDSRFSLLLKPYVTTSKSKMLMLVNVSPASLARRESMESLKVAKWVDPDEQSSSMSPQQQNIIPLSSSKSGQARPRDTYKKAKLVS